jgi:hypothetical protein
MKSQFTHALRRLDASEVGRPHGRRRMKNIIAGSLDARVQPLYDYWAVAAGGSSFREETLFQIAWGGSYTPAGGSQLIKTYYHTNLTGSGGSLPAPNKLLVKNISIMTRPDMHPTDVVNLAGQYVVEFNTLQKTFWRGHAQKLPAGAGVFVNGFNSGAAAATALSCYSAANGWPTASNCSPLVMDTPAIANAQVNPILGVLLEQQQPFYLDVNPTLTQTTAAVTTTTATTGVASVGVIAWGYLEGIQLVAIV